MIWIPSGKNYAIDPEDYTELVERVGPRLRESRLVASSGRGGEFPQPSARFFAQPCMCGALAKVVPFASSVFTDD